MESRRGRERGKGGPNGAPAVSRESLNEVGRVK